jgi:hypothetical protein
MSLNPDPCKEKDEKQKELKVLTKEFRSKVKECEESLYGSFVDKYFTNIDGSQLTHNNLLKGLFNYYKDEKTKDINFILTFQHFIDKFPRDTAVGKTNFKKQHIFEALCRLLLLFDYDNGELGYAKTFFDRLENIINNSKTELKIDVILNKSVNEASAGGIVDILFQTNLSEKAKIDGKMSACELVYDNQEAPKSESPEKIPTTIMIQNKYFDKEKSNIDKYDVTRMHALAGHPVIKKEGKHQIILMVNNEEALSSNLLKSKQQYKDVIHKIYGVAQIDKWFQDLLYDFVKIDSEDDLKKKLKSKQSIQNEVDKPLMNPRFHQLLITNSTVRYNNEQKIWKFIWGAVPRSGKSFMVADLVDKRKEIGNDVVIILGAKTETEQQFIDEMFTKYSNFEDCKILTPERVENKTGKRNIYILSQEWFKTGKIKKVEGKTLFNDVVKEKFPDLIKKGKKIDIFFDEIHKGGHSPISLSILQTFVNSKLLIDIFVMVTATFAKPIDTYNNTFIDSSPTQIIEWSYNDQQNMKQVKNDTKKQMMINSRNEMIEKEVMEELFDDYQTRYGVQYLSVLSSEYDKYPELVMITPQILNPDENIFPNHSNDVRNVFMNNLKCDACESGKEVAFYRKSVNIFKQEGPVDDLLKYISHKIYNSFQTKFQYPISSSHTELWFLPDKNLYENDCSKICKKMNEVHQEEEDMLGGGLIDYDTEEEQDVLGEGLEEGLGEGLGEEGDDEKDDKNNNSIPNIEPLTRGLAIKIVNDSSFNRYNVFIVHNTDLNYLIKTKIFDGFANRIRLYDFKNKKTSLKDQIKKFEKETYELGRSLIILTGAKLRLGISLTCADIAFNFDNIKSVDNNYQTMFRVLTEREKPQMKKYGYYLDFNKDRSISFLYEYSAVYGEKNNKKTLKESIEYLQTLLFSFNYNGLNLVAQDTKQELGMYNELIEKLALSQEKYIEYWSKDKNLVSLIQKALNQSNNKEDLKKLGEALEMKITKKPKKIDIRLKKGEDRKKMEQERNKYHDDETKSDDYKEGYKTGYDEGYEKGKNGESPIIPDETIIDEYEKGHDAGFKQGYAVGYNERYDEDNMEEEEEPLNIDKIIEFLSNSIPSIISLLALYSQENELNCHSIEDCLENSIKQIEGFTELCKCSNIDSSNIVDCFLNSPKNIDGNYVTENHDKIKENLTTVLNIIKKEIITNPLMRQSLELKFNIILKEMKHQKDALIVGMKTDDIKQLIEDNLTVKKEEKDKFGEVFTPPKLINEMLDKLPKEVWTNPDFKWLDPANGIGNFPMIVYERLIKKLPGNYKNSKGDGYNDLLSKQKWILENMLYMVELNPKNVKISKKIFGDNANIFCGDFLTMDMKKETGIEKFDIIIGNPPFQGNGRKKPYINIIYKCINTLHNKGYLLFVTPKMSIGFLLGSEVSQVKIKKFYNILFINTSNDIKYKYFNKIGSDFTYFLVQNDEYKDNTHIIYDDNMENDITLNFNSILTTDNTRLYKDIFIKLLKINENQWGRSAARIEKNLVDKEDTSHPNKIIYKMKTDPKNDEYKWTSETHKDMNKYKVFYPTLGDRYIIDKYHNLFPGTSFVPYILCNSLNECNNIVKLGNSRLFKFLKNAFKSQRSSVDYIWRNLIKPSSFDIEIKSDADIYKYFGLTKNDINVIENEDIQSTLQSSEALEKQQTPPVKTEPELPKKRTKKIHGKRLVIIGESSSSQPTTAASPPVSPAKKGGTKKNYKYKNYTIKKSKKYKSVYKKTLKRKN